MTGFTSQTTRLVQILNILHIYVNDNLLILFLKVAFRNTYYLPYLSGIMTKIITACSLGYILLFVCVKMPGQPMGREFPL